MNEQIDDYLNLAFQSEWTVTSNEGEHKVKQYRLEVITTELSWAYATGGQPNVLIKGFQFPYFYDSYMYLAGDTFDEMLDEKPYIQSSGNYKAATLLDLDNTKFC